MPVVVLGAKLAMPMHKPKVYWKLRSRAHQKGAPGFANAQSATPACKQNLRIILIFAQPKLRIMIMISFCDVDFTFLHSKIPTSYIKDMLHLWLSRIKIFAPLLILSRRLVSVSADSEKSRFEYLNLLTFHTTHLPAK